MQTPQASFGVSQAAQHATQTLQKLYADFARGDIAAVLDACAETMTFQVAGKSKLAGKYTKATFASGFVTPMMELSGGTLSIEVHDILASDRHAVVLASDWLTRGGERSNYEPRMSGDLKMENHARGTSTPATFIITTPFGAKLWNRSV